MKFIRKHTGGPLEDAALNYLIERAEILFQRANEMSGFIDEAITWGSSGLDAQECLRETDEELSRIIEIIKAAGVEVINE